MASIEPDERVVGAETGGELALSTVRGAGRFLPLEVVWRHPEVSETCLKVVSKRNHVTGYCWDLNGVNRAR